MAEINIRNVEEAAKEIAKIPEVGPIRADFSGSDPVLDIKTKPKLPDNKVEQVCSLAGSIAAKMGIKRFRCESFEAQ